MINSNEQALLTYLEEQHQQTKSSMISENHTLWYWKSGNHFKDDEFKQLTNAQIDFFITNGEERVDQLHFILKWLEKEISNLQSLISLTQPNK